MRVSLAGGSEGIGRRLVPMLVAAGHEVTATTTEAKAEALRRAGARPVVLDVLDGDDVRAAVGQARPEAVRHTTTSWSSSATISPAPTRPPATSTHSVSATRSS